MTFDEALKLTEEEESNLYNANGIKINVYGSEGRFPHLHYYFSRVEGCIRLDVPRYFCHENYHDGLNSGEKKFMIDWLRKNWRNCVNEWNRDSRQEKIPENYLMPDYNLLPKLEPNGKLAKENRR